MRGCLRSTVVIRSRGACVSSGAVKTSFDGNRPPKPEVTKAVYARQAFPPLKNDLILRAARGEKTERVPVWIMRQAGRYLPEYREVSRRYGFFEICRTPELACKVTMQPINRFNLDAAIIFCDILVIPQALGMVIEMKAGIGPYFPAPLKSPEDVDKLPASVDVHKELGYVFDAIRLTRKTLAGKVPLIGFAGAPCTLMNYMIEGMGSRTMSRSKAMMYQHPAACHRLLRLLTDVIIDYLVGQVQAGAQMLQVFESHAEFLSPKAFDEYSLVYLKTIRERVRKGLAERDLEDVPMVIFAKGAHYALEQLGRIGYEVVSLDWTIDPKKARALVGDRVTLQGNLDPCALYSSKEDIELIVQEMIGAFGTHRYIANLGHGIYPDMDPANVAVFVDTTHRISEQLNSDISK